MLNALFVTVTLLTLSPTPPPGQVSPAPRLSRSGAPVAGTGRVHAPVPVAKGTELPEPMAERLTVADPNALYSVRARKRFAAYLRFRLLELREEHLSRAAEAIEHHISVSSLLEGP